MKIQVTACDRCGLRDDNGKVSSWTSRRGNVRYVGDLCDPCWTELVSIFRPSNMPKGKHKVQATRIEDIPKK